MLIGFAGLAGAGKNEAANALPYETIAFADPLKNLVEKLDPFVSFHPASGMIRLSDLRKYESFELIKRYSPELRRLLQELGVNIRNLDPDFWVKALNAKIGEWENEDPAWSPRGIMDHYCVPDVRFQNEVDYVKRDGFVIWIERPGVEQGPHISENSVTAEDCDGYVLNDGTVEELHEKVRAELKALCE